MHEKVAFVTGSSKGIGRAIALELARRGADVAVNCRTSVEQAQAVCAEVERLGRRSVLVTGDTRVPEDVERMIATVSSILGDVDILVNNAAYALLKPFLDFTVEEWKSQIEYKALAYFLTSRAVLPAMIRRRSGAIINILSTVGMRGGAGEMGYAVTNGGAMALTRALAAEIGQTGVRVNGVMLTWAENAFDPEDPEHVAWLNRFAMGRVTKLDEVARVVAFLASDEASGITGAIVPVDAGFMCQ
ncbi:MAG TPA: SDR family oxidoreductase [Firmicutes bacterium]|nr:SDR family oxidoreductase [Bacillota bacterium]